MQIKGGVYYKNYSGNNNVLILFTVKMANIFLSSMTDYKKKYKKWNKHKKNKNRVK